MVDVKFSMFFDRGPAMKKFGDGMKSRLSMAGAFVRTAAQRLIRPRKKSAEPGSPPSSHVGTLRRLIFFGYDRSTESVVIGPKFNPTIRSGRVPVPKLLEFGGPTINWRGQHAVYHAFPFMAPALKSEYPKFPELFTDVLGH